MKLEKGGAWHGESHTHHCPLPPPADFRSSHESSCVAGKRLLPLSHGHQPITPILCPSATQGEVARVAESKPLALDMRNSYVWDGGHFVRCPPHGWCLMEVAWRAWRCLGLWVVNLKIPILCLRETNLCAKPHRTCAATFPTKLLCAA